MHSQILVVAHANRLPRIESCGGVAARCTAPDTIYLVSAAATPLGGDTIEVRLIVEPDARLKLRNAAATVVLPGAATRTSHADWQIDLAGDLDIDLEPTIVAADARHIASTVLHLHDDGCVRLRERVQIGRYGEREGFWSGSLRVDRDHRALVRHRVELGIGSLADVLFAPRASINELCCPAMRFPAPVDGQTTVLTLAGGGTLSTWQGDQLTG